MVLLGEIRHWTRTLLTFTRPYFGTARSMSKTLAVSTNSGGSSSRSWMLDAAGLEIALELSPPRADLVRTLERLHPLHERPLGGCHGGLGRRLRGRRHGGESTSESRAGKPNFAQFASTSTELRDTWRRVDGVSLDLQGFFRRYVLYAARSGAGLRRAIPLFARDSASSAATLAPAIGSRKLLRSDRHHVGARLEHVPGLTSALDPAHSDDRDLDPRSNLGDLGERDGADRRARTRRPCRRRARARRAGAGGTPCRAAC